MVMLLVGRGRRRAREHLPAGRPRRRGGHSASSFLTFLARGLSSSTSPARRRLRDADLCSSRWARFFCRVITLPLRVTRKRFLAPLWVFCLGMIVLTDRRGGRSCAGGGLPAHRRGGSGVGVGRGRVVLGGLGADRGEHHHHVAPVHLR